MTRTMYDISSPEASGQPSADVAAGYIGGDTPHVWSKAEWDEQPPRLRLPIWVRSNPGSFDPVNDANNCVAKLHELGVPQGCTVALDFEIAVNSTFVKRFDNVLLVAGYRVLLYGSESSVFGNVRPSAGYWTANWNGVPHIDAGAEATQYINGNYDHSLISETVQLWGNTVTPPPPPEDDLPYSEAQLEAIVSKAVTSQPTRDALVYAFLWWLDKIANDTVPAAATDAEKAVCVSIRVGLVGLIKSADTV